MNVILKSLLDDPANIFEFFEQVFVFGSSLYADSPNDVDILLIYEDSKIGHVKSEKARVERMLNDILDGFDFDFTTFSVSEFAQTNFLVDVEHFPIKG